MKITKKWKETKKVKICQKTEKSENYGNLVFNMKNFSKSENSGKKWKFFKKVKISQIRENY